ncbi:MAG: tetratricopeptide repeat protein [Phycisphaerae bacterium]|nr:tetratricopeptide repeat protein [Phycisphaerae bacterium]
MSDIETQQQIRQKSDELFAQARAMGEAGDFDQAILAYIEGLRLTPDHLKAHMGLRGLALQRRQAGGENPTDSDIQAHDHGQTPLDEMLNAEYLFAKQPDHLPYAERLLRSAVAGGYRQTARWIADMLFVANSRCSKPTVKTYILLKDMYEGIEAYDRAIRAVKHALKLKPKDRQLAEDLRELTHRASHAPEAKPEQDLPEQSDRDPADSNHDAAMLFFAKAEKTAKQGNYDYAIDMFIDGLRKDPEALEDGHLALARIGLKRQAHGSKKPSMMERARLFYGKTPLDQMLNAEFLYAKDPSHLGYAEAMLKAAVAGGYNRTAGWIANLIFQINNAHDKPSYQTYILLKDSYQALKQYDKAVAACQWAMKLRPDKADLTEEYKNLSAELTMANGKYDQGGDFRKSIKDARKQEHLYAQDRTVKTQDWRELAVEEARKAYEKHPSVSKNVFDLATALDEMETPAHEQEALDVLEQAFMAQHNFSFREKAGQLRIKQIKRHLRKILDALENSPDSPEMLTQREETKGLLLKTELEHYKACTKNYPTNRRYAYEYALRLVQTEAFDQAIPLFQESRKDPSRRVLSINQIGLCFFKKGWMTDAIDVFSQAIKEHELKDDALGKDLRYNLGRAYEAKGEHTKALDIYRKIAQSDFTYKDVRDRVNQLRSG